MVAQPSDPDPSLTAHSPMCAPIRAATMVQTAATASAVILQGPRGARVLGELDRLDLVMAVRRLFNGQLAGEEHEPGRWR